MLDCEYRGCASGGGELLEAQGIPVVLFVEVLYNVEQVVDVLAAEVGAEDGDVGALWLRW